MRVRRPRGATARRAAALPTAGSQLLRGCEHGCEHARRDSQTQSGKCSTLYVTALGQCLAADATKGKGH